jgi:hypothetical protein
MLIRFSARRAKRTFKPQRIIKKTCEAKVLLGQGALDNAIPSRPTRETLEPVKDLLNWPPAAGSMGIGR